VTAAPVVVTGTTAALTANTLAVSADGGAVVTGGASVTATNVVVPASSNGVINVQSTSTATSTVVVGTTSVPTGSTLSLTGSGDVNVSASTGGGTICVAGPCVTGTVTTAIGPCDPTASGNAQVLNVCRNLTVPSIVGTPATGSVNVAAGATLTATGSGATISANVTLSGTLVVGGVTSSGSVSITAGGVLSIVPDVTVPHITLASCAATGTITIQLPIACSTITTNGASGPIITGSINVANFGCGIVVTGSGGCTLPPLKVQVSATGSSRRLLGGSSSCGTANVGSTGATYNYCPTTNGASHAQLSSIALFVSLFISLLFVRF